MPLFLFSGYWYFVSSWNQKGDSYWSGFQCLWCWHSIFIIMDVESELKLCGIFILIGVGWECVLCTATDVLRESVSFVLQLMCCVRACPLYCNWCVAWVCVLCTATGVFVAWVYVLCTAADVFVVRECVLCTATDVFVVWECVLCTATANDLVIQSGW
jgi:hypothetical protein